MKNFKETIVRTAKTALIGMILGTQLHASTAATYFVKKENVSIGIATEAEAEDYIEGNTKCIKTHKPWTNYFYEEKICNDSTVTVQEMKEQRQILLYKVQKEDKYLWIDGEYSDVNIMVTASQKEAMNNLYQANESGLRSLVSSDYAVKVLLEKQLQAIAEQDAPLINKIMESYYIIVNEAEAANEELKLRLSTEQSKLEKEFQLKAKEFKNKYDNLYKFLKIFLIKPFENIQAKQAEQHQAELQTLTKTFTDKINTIEANKAIYIHHINEFALKPIQIETMRKQVELQLNIAFKQKLNLSQEDFSTYTNFGLFRINDWELVADVAMGIFTVVSFVFIAGAIVRVVFIASRTAYATYAAGKGIISAVGAGGAVVGEAVVAEVMATLAGVQFAIQSVKGGFKVIVKTIKNPAQAAKDIKSSLKKMTFGGKQLQKALAPFGKNHSYANVPNQRNYQRWANKWIGNGSFKTWFNSKGYPEFKSPFKVNLGYTKEQALSLAKNSNSLANLGAKHFREANLKLKQALLENPKIINQFPSIGRRDIKEAILNNKTPKGYTWHHSERGPNQLELVAKKFHERVNAPHDGGISLYWKPLMEAVGH